MGSRGGSTETVPITVSACPIFTGLVVTERSVLDFLKVENSSKEHFYKTRIQIMQPNCRE